MLQPARAAPIIELAFWTGQRQSRASRYVEKPHRSMKGTRGAPADYALGRGTCSWVTLSSIEWCRNVRSCPLLRMTETGIKPPRTHKSRRLGMREIARSIGVAPITVSRALRDPGKVSPETRRKIMEAIDREGFIPNQLAGSMPAPAAS